MMKNSMPEEQILNRGPTAMLATSSLDVRIVQNVGKPKELRVPATIFSSVHPDK
jgi:hypothetical protein